MMKCWEFCLRKWKMFCNGKRSVLQVKKFCNIVLIYEGVDKQLAWRLSSVEALLKAPLNR